MKLRFGYYSEEDIMKVCPTCRKEKSLILDFGKNSRNKDGYTRECSSCINKYKNTPKRKAVATNTRHKRRAKCKITDITKEWLQDFKLISYYCSLCGVIMNEKRINNPTKKHLDHIIPLGKGGTHTMDNVRYICQTCNLSRPKDGSDYKQAA